MIFLAIIVILWILFSEPSTTCHICHGDLNGSDHSRCVYRGYDTSK